MDLNEILSSLSKEDIEDLRLAAQTVIGEAVPRHDDGGIDLATISKLGASFSADSERVALVKALKPLLSEERKQKADEAIKMLRFIELIPRLRESGILGELL